MNILLVIVHLSWDMSVGNGHKIMQIMGLNYGYMIVFVYDSINIGYYYILIILFLPLKF